MDIHSSLTHALKVASGDGLPQLQEEAHHHIDRIGAGAGKTYHPILSVGFCLSR